MKKSYWNYEKKSNKIILPENEYREGLEQKISEVVKSHMVSDREISCFLSGGVDSSLISLMTQKNSQKKIKTYTVGFNDRNFDEAKHAKEISKYIQSDHHEIYLNSKDMLDTIYTLGEIYDEPFADSSQVPTSIICKWISNYHKVVLSGDGGDELFLGYNRYAHANKIYNILSLFPSFPKKLLSYLLSWTISFNKVFNDNYSNIRFEKLKRLIELKGDENLKFNIYKLLVSYMLDPTKFLIDKNKTNFEIYKQIKNFRDNSFKTSMQNTDLSFYLPNDILNKVDRASMYFGLEVRVPFLDRRLFEFILMYQTKFHEKKFTKKTILKEILYKTIPRNLIDRPKHGFAVPLKKWISKDLNKYIKKMILDNLDEQTFDKQQILNLFKNNTYYNASII